MNLDKIQEMWERDANIDPDNLHNESNPTKPYQWEMLHHVRHAW